MPPLLAEIKKRFEEIMWLKPGWDGYKGVPVSSENAYFSLNLLRSICKINTPIPQIIPGANGDLQIEWHTLRSQA